MRIIAFVGSPVEDNEKDVSYVICMLLVFMYYPANISFVILILIISEETFNSIRLLRFCVDGMVDMLGKLAAHHTLDFGLCCLFTQK